MQLRNKVALVTGGSAGIGYELAQQLSGKGAHVVIVARDRDRAEAAVSSLPGRGDYLLADLACPDAQEALVRDVERRWPDLSLLINNAGVQVNLSAVGLTAGLGDEDRLPEMRAEIAINLVAPVVLSFGLMPLLATQPEAGIVNISSGLAIAPKRTAPVYCATKAALRTFTTALRYRCEDLTATLKVCDVVMDYTETGMTAGRGGHKLSARQAAREVVAGIERDRDEIWVGRTRWLGLLHRLSPSRARRLMRQG